MRANLDDIHTRPQFRAQHNFLASRQIALSTQNHTSHDIAKHEFRLTRAPIQHFDVHDIFRRIGIDDKVIRIRLVIVNFAWLVSLVHVKIVLYPVLKEISDE